MKSKAFAYLSLLAAVLLGGVTLAQAPVQDIDPKLHPYLAEAQKYVVEANQAIAIAQKDNHDDMKGHAEKARQLLVEVNNELKGRRRGCQCRKRCQEEIAIRLSRPSRT